VDTVLGHVLTWPFLFVAKAIAEGSTTKVFDKVHINLDFTYIDDIVSGVQVFLQNPPTQKEGKASCQISNIGNGSSQSLAVFIKAIETSFGWRLKK